MNGVFRQAEHFRHFRSGLMLTIEQHQRLAIGRRQFT